MDTLFQREFAYAALGTGFTCLATVLGAAMVFFFRRELSAMTQKLFLGFAAGVMVAASVWSLLIPPWNRPGSRPPPARPGRWPWGCRSAAALCWARAFCF